jgi:hypothetical protein
MSMPLFNLDFKDDFADNHCYMKRSTEMVMMNVDMTLLHHECDNIYNQAKPSDKTIGHVFSYGRCQTHWNDIARAVISGSNFQDLTDDTWDALCTTIVEKLEMIKTERQQFLDLDLIS